MRISQIYLVLYNALQACGWAAVLGAILYGVLQKGRPEQLYNSAGFLTKLVQGASLLETLHAAVGLVPSSPLMSLMQWMGRSNVFFLILEPNPQVRMSWWSVLMMGTWAAAEVIRYPQYMLSTALGERCPHWLTWLRYTMFIPLYPVGVVAEMGLMVAALPYLAASKPYSLELPNAYNWAFSYHRFIQIVLALYPFLWWQLYSALLRSRSKKLTQVGRGRGRRREEEGYPGEGGREGKETKEYGARHDVQPPPPPARGSRGQRNTTQRTVVADSSDGGCGVGGCGGCVRAFVLSRNCK
ncbi:hypothetical protein VOLCADRAFT_61480 [Volvox carteri f. nagariensis]|uniref:Very-long-chain (3R)-3-hydroxyacyl-CoA dehydratase n=1 Tax=Volvox carteri f. nagariensis TaxID=3068 RepID=D8TYW8_VOLCA|nr:uncharacterized protein VOLCADRAFT_61480 [Volvox carteri f. nagariensis]EFJ47290.1 hypothetical protein VOLCADRAFT_61480 [Volvox carteri f. nagariensis]|eukprot:XP_002951479.1 hypothetical protein VOLCADRAFT_61480 [Volvox carteri f. nagariensis]